MSHTRVPERPYLQSVLGFDRIARRIGVKLRDVYGSPEAEPLPVEHVDLLLKLRHKEREVLRRTMPTS